MLFKFDDVEHILANIGVADRLFPKSVTSRENGYELFFNADKKISSKLNLKQSSDSKAAGLLMSQLHSRARSKLHTSRYYNIYYDPPDYLPRTLVFVVGDLTLCALEI